MYRNHSAGLRIHCAERKKTFSGQAKIPSQKVILYFCMDLCCNCEGTEQLQGIVDYFYYRIAEIREIARGCQKVHPFVR